MQQALHDAASCGMMHDATDLAWSTRHCLRLTRLKATDCSTAISFANDSSQMPTAFGKVIGNLRYSLLHVCKSSVIVVVVKGYL